MIGFFSAGLPLSFASHSFTGTEGQSVPVCVRVASGYSTAMTRTVTFSIDSVMGSGKYGLTTCYVTE